MTDELKARVEKTIKNLKRNNMDAYFCENAEEARELVKTLIKKGDTITNGGSATLKQTGVYDIISSSDYNYLDRSREGITREEVEEIYLKAFRADAFFTSANAITENGELYNVDGNSNPVRLNLDTYCNKTGKCVSLQKDNPELCDGCHSAGRVCCNYVVSAQQRHVGRIKVIIIGEEYGY